MAIVKFYDINGAVVNEEEVPLSFEPKPSDEEILAKAIKRQLANARNNYASTKTRSMMRGGGAKPWRQKGTGRARHGSSRSPIWRGGAVTFGPNKNQNFRESMNRKERRRAMQVGLMSKIMEGNFKIVKGMNLENPSTRESINILNALEIKGNKVLFLANRGEDVLFFSFRNITDVECLPADRVNGFSLVNNDNVLATPEAYEFIKEVWLS